MYNIKRQIPNWNKSRNHVTVYISKLGHVKTIPQLS